MPQLIRARYIEPLLDAAHFFDQLVSGFLSNADNHDKDILGHRYKYFLSQFASSEGK